MTDRFRAGSGERHVRRRRVDRLGDGRARILDDPARFTAEPMDGRWIAGPLKRFRHGGSRCVGQRSGGVVVQIDGH